MIGRNPGGRTEAKDVELTGFGELEGIEHLQKLPLFATLTFDEATRLSSILQTRDVPAGTVLIEQNALGDALFILLSGEARVSRDVDGDGQHTASEELGTLGPGELFGEMSLVDDVLTSARVSAATPARVLRLPRRDFEALLQGQDALALKIYRAFCRTLTDRLRKTNRLLAAQQAHAVAVR
jgi:CRP-like cAMP-binding protein